MGAYTSILLLNIISYYALKLKGLLKLEEDQPQMNNFQFNTIAKNPKIIKEIVFFGIGIVAFTASGICQGLIVQVPQSFDKTLAINLFLFICFGFVIPFLVWISNKSIQKHAIREFWDVAPVWLVDLKNIYFSQNIDQRSTRQTIELSTVSQSIHQIQTHNVVENLQGGSSRRTSCPLNEIELTEIVC